MKKLTLFVSILSFIALMSCEQQTASTGKPGAPKAATRIVPDTMRVIETPNGNPNIHYIIHELDGKNYLFTWMRGNSESFQVVPMGEVKNTSDNPFIKNNE